MTFTDGLPHVATEEDLTAPWGGYWDGRRFCCSLCGHRFAVGDVWRWQSTPPGMPNFFVCQDCDGADVSERYRVQFAEAKRLAHLLGWLPQ